MRDLTGGKVRYNPAYAGTTYAPQGVADTAAIQPRVCGDYCCKLKRNRYNPAYAGTTSLYEKLSLLIALATVLKK